MEKCETYVDMLRHMEKGNQNPRALNQRDSDGYWHATSTKVCLETVRLITLGLKQMGLKRGDKVGILATSSPEWTMVDVAIVLAGGISVPLFTTISEENFLYEIKQTKLKIIFVEGLDQWTLFRHYEEFFRQGIALGEDVPEHDKVMSLQTLKDSGKAMGQKDPQLYDKLLKEIKPNEVTTIIYTSGSTGVPKGVELTQLNMIGEVEFEEFRWDSKKDCYLSVLPLEHVFGHCFNLWMLYHGVSIYYSNDHKHLAQICSEVKPTMIAVVPRLLERVYAKIVEKTNTAGLFKRALGRWALHLAHHHKSREDKTLLFRLADALVYSKFRAALGGNLRMLISGGAALNPRLLHFFEVIGVPIYQGWGLTEACPLATTTPVHNKSGTVGRLLPGQQVKIAPSGEILVKGSLVMHGYYDDPGRTKETIDGEGYLHTGDKGVLDDEGYLTIVGRLKELYKSSTGEYIAPVPIEQSICRHPLVDMALVIAEGRKYASCLIFPNMEVLERLKKKQQAESVSMQTFLATPYIRNEMNLLLEEVNQHLNHPEQIRDYRFVTEPLTIKGGDLTPSLKIRREPVIKKYRELIDTMYHKEVEE